MFCLSTVNKQQDSFVSCALSDFFAMCCGGAAVYVLVPGEVYIVGSSTPRPSACSELILLQF